MLNKEDKEIVYKLKNEWYRKLNERNYRYLFIRIFFNAFIYWAYVSSTILREWCMFAAAMLASDMFNFN